MLSDTKLTCFERLPTGRTKSADLEARQKPALGTPVTGNVLRQRNAAAVPYTVGHCHIKRLSFLKSLSTDIPDYQRDIEASRSVLENIVLT